MSENLHICLERNSRRPFTAFAGRKRLTAFIVSVAFIITLSGCSFIRLPSARDYEKINAGKCALVLYRVTCDINGQPFEAFLHSVEARDNIGIATGGFETGGDVTLIFPPFLSKQTQHEGWTYMLLEPGLHYLVVSPPQRTDLNSYEKQLKSAPRFRVDIPVNTRLVYIGNIHLPGTEQKFLFGVRSIGSFIDTDIVVNNEPELAEKIAAEFFPQLGLPVNSLMERHTGPIILRTPPTLSQ